MDREKLESAVANVAAENDPTVKSLKLASLCSTLWAEQGVRLIVVGGSAIEILTEGAYTSGDLDLCSETILTVPLRQRQEIMGALGAKGGPRNWQVAGMFVDLLGPVESFARTPFRRVRGPYGEVLIMKPEDLLVERVLVSTYPQEDATAGNAAKKLIGAMLGNMIDVDWSEVGRVANLPEYRNWQECAIVVKEVADELGIKSPLDPA